MAFAAGEGLDLERSWLKVEVSQDQYSETKYEICPSPYALVGTAIEPQHRVIQVCVGAEHGVMRTDAGIAFTLGDNRYGQLGRVPVLKEENGTPFPVLDLLDEEVIQVAAGKNHCLALLSDGGVKSWGRNKMGQLGIGSFRDKVEPQWVRLQPQREGEDGVKLGGLPGDPMSIVTISAGGNSSIAAGSNADVWQWGDLNSAYKASTSKEKKKGTDKDGGATVNKAFPYKVASWKDKSFRTQMRKEKDRVSISETLCLVLSKEDTAAKVRIKDLADEDKRWRQEIAKERKSGQVEAEERSRRGGKDKSADSENDGGELGDLQDTIAFLERDIEVISRDLDLYEKNIQSCEQMQTHNRKQIEMLTHQATQLTESQGKYSEQKYSDEKLSGQQKKQLEIQLHEIKDFIEANANTRATLLDQRAETDKEKQHLSFELNNKKRQKEEYQKRLEMVKFLGTNTRNSTGASDHWVSFLGKEKEELTSHFEGKPLGNADILEAKKKLEKDEAYVRDVELRMNEMLESSQFRNNSGERPEACKALLDDLVDLRRRLNDLTADKYFKEDLNFECFFKDAQKPDPA